MEGASPPREDADSSFTRTTCCTTKCVGSFNKKEVMQCSKCNRSVHFRCSLLPPYQIQYFIANRRRNMTSFCCIKCTDVSKDVTDLCKENNTQELLLRIQTLERDVEACKNIIKVHQEKEHDTLSTIAIYKGKITKLKEKTINNHTVEYLGKKMLEIGSMIKQSICEEIKNTNEEIKTEISDVTKSYASAAKNGPVQNNINDLKTIINEARHAEITEQRDRQSRTNNIIIHGVAENETENEADNVEVDRNYAKTLFDIIKATVTIKRVSRIGLRANDKNRPIKVSLANEKEKSIVLRSLVALKNNTNYTGMSISEYLTIAERAVLKEWVDKAKSRNQGLPSESNSIWRVRGDSKNGYRLKEFKASQ